MNWNDKQECLQCALYIESFELKSAVTNLRIQGIIGHKERVGNYPNLGFLRNEQFSELLFLFSVNCNGLLSVKSNENPLKLSLTRLSSAD